MKSDVVFNIVNEQSNEVIIEVMGVIGDECYGFTAKDFATQLQSLKGKNITLRINSPGGLVPDGLMIYDLLNQHDAGVRTEVYGASASIATIISQAGHRTMSDNALMLIHHAWGFFGGNKFVLKEAIQALEKFDERIRNIYIKRGADEEKIDLIMAQNNGDGAWINADEALEAGLIDEIISTEDVRAEVNNDLLKNLGLPDLPKNATLQSKPQVGEESSNEEKTKNEANAERISRIIETLKL